MNVHERSGGHPNRLDGLLADAAAELPEAFWEEAEPALPAPEHWLAT